MGALWSDSLAVFDLETTGVDVETARIVTANIAVIDAAGVVIEKWDWIADPGIQIPDQAAAVHGVTTQQARAEGRPAAQVVSEIVAVLGGLLDRRLPLTIYNAPYDLTVLDREARRHGITPLVSPGPIIDPLVIDKHLDTYRKGKRTLEAAAVFYGVSLTDAHDAGADALAAGRIAQALVSKYPAELQIEANELHKKQADWCQQQSDSFQDYMRRTRDPSFTTSGEWPIRQ